MTNGTAATAPPVASEATVGSGEYKVRHGEDLRSIAQRKGVPPGVIWDDPANADVKAARGDGACLLPGDRLHIPARRTQTTTSTTDGVFKAEVDVPKATLLLRVLWGGKPRAKERYRLAVGATVHSDDTDAEGWLHQEIPLYESQAFLSLTVDQAVQTFRLCLATLHPVNTISGVQQRLQNLGYDGGATPGTLDERASHGLAAFQGEHGIRPVTGQLDQATLDALTSAHGS